MWNENLKRDMLRLPLDHDSESIQDAFDIFVHDHDSNPYLVRVTNEHKLYQEDLINMDKVMHRLKSEADRMQPSDVDQLAFFLNLYIDYMQAKLQPPTF